MWNVIDSGKGLICPPSSLTWAGCNFNSAVATLLHSTTSYQKFCLFREAKMFFSGRQRSSTLPTTKKQRKTKTASHLTDGTESCSRSENAAVRSCYSLSVPTPVSRQPEMMQKTITRPGYHRQPSTLCGARKERGAVWDPPPKSGLTAGWLVQVVAHAGRVARTKMGW